MKAILLATTFPQNTLLTTRSLSLAPVTPQSIEASCEENSGNDTNNDDVVLVVIAIACEVESQRRVDNSKDDEAEAEDHVNFANDRFLAAAEQEMVEETAESLEGE